MFRIEYQFELTEGRFLMATKSTQNKLDPPKLLYGISSISFPGKILGRIIKDTNAPKTSQGNQRDNPDRFGSSLDSVSVSCESGSEDLFIPTSYGLFSSFYLR